MLMHKEAVGYTHKDNIILATLRFCLYYMLIFAPESKPKKVINKSISKQADPPKYWQYEFFGNIKECVISLLSLWTILQT